MREYSSWIWIWLALLVFAGCQKEPNPPLRIGTNPWVGFEYLYLAQEKGFFAEESVDVKLIDFGSLADSRRAFERGQVDGLCSTLIEMLQIRVLSKRSAQAVLVLDFSEGADNIIADSSISDMKHLKGKRVGAELATFNMYFLERALEKNGLKLDDVTIISVAPMDMQKALENHEIDAAVTYQPYSSVLLRKKTYREIFSSKDIPGEVADVLIVDGSVLAKRKNDIVRIIRAWDRAVKYASSHRQETNQMMLARGKISQEELTTAMAGIHLPSLEEQYALLSPGGVLEKSIVLCEDVLRRFGEIPGSVPCTDCLSTEALTLLKGRR
jgi:NitT/TauT family transport system substrate-binding protein